MSKIQDLANTARSCILLLFSFYNCNAVSLTDPSGVTDVTGKITDNTEVARYTIDGQRINAPRHGINIVKMADGSTRKVLIK